jgi:hypothetical protein
MAIWMAGYQSSGNRTLQEATSAYGAAESKHDVILMASARNLQWNVEQASVEEEIEGWADHAPGSPD